jgi:hypothetical protein
VWLQTIHFDSHKQAFMRAPLARLFATSASIMSSSSFYGLTAIKGDGGVLPMEELRGKVVYATNVASM